MYHAYLFSEEFFLYKFDGAKLIKLFEFETKFLTSLISINFLKVIWR